MVKASKAGSLSFKDTCLVTISVSFFSHVKNLHHHHWNVLKLFLDCDNFHVPIICSLIVLSGYYLLSCFCCCCFKVHIEIPINGCKLFACFYKLCNCNTSMITKRLLFTVTLLFLFHNLHCRISLNKSRFKFWKFFPSLLSSKCS